MKLKDNSVKIDNLDERLKSKLENIESICKYYNGMNYVMTITSGNEKHMSNSLHYENKAIDIRIRDMKYPELTAKLIKLTYDKELDVVVEKDHIHIEYQPKKRKGGKK